MRKSNVLLLCVLFLVCTQQAVAQDPFGGCAEFSVTPDGAHCWRFITRTVQFGGGWTVTTDSANTGAENPGQIQTFWVINPTSAAHAVGVWSVSAFGRDNFNPQGFITLAGIRGLSPGESNELVLVAPLTGCDEHGQECSSTPDLSTVVEAVLTVGIVADGPEALRGLALPVVTVEVEKAKGPRVVPIRISPIRGIPILPVRPMLPDQPATSAGARVIPIR